MSEKENTLNDSDNYPSNYKLEGADDTILTRLGKRIKVFSGSLNDIEGAVNEWIEINDPQEVQVIPTYAGGIILSYTAFRQDKITMVKRYVPTTTVQHDDL
jgi:hypothetical protein